MQEGRLDWGRQWRRKKTGEEAEGRNDQRFFSFNTRLNLLIWCDFAWIFFWSVVVGRLNTNSPCMRMCVFVHVCMCVCALPRFQEVMVNCQSRGPLTEIHWCGKKFTTPLLHLLTPPSSFQPPWWAKVGQLPFTDQRAHTHTHTHKARDTSAWVCLSVVYWTAAWHARFMGNMSAISLGISNNASQCAWQPWKTAWCLETASPSSQLPHLGSLWLAIALSLCLWAHLSASLSISHFLF